VQTAFWVILLYVALTFINAVVFDAAAARSRRAGRRAWFVILPVD
jgi:hypothetical protein